MKLLSPLDQMFARMEAPRTPMHIGAFAVFDLPKGAPRRFIRDLYEAISQLAFLPFPFDSVIAGGASMAYWRQVQPDPSYHVRLSALPYPGTGRDLGALVERLHSTPLDMAKPLWELHLIEGLTGRQFAMYFKAHHCAVDGLGGVNLIKSWLTTDPEAPPGSGKPEPFGDDYDLASVLAAATTKRAAEGVQRGWQATMVLTEPDAGSDVGAGRTKAFEQPDGTWHIEGVKRFISGGDVGNTAENIFHLVLARPEGAGPGTKGLSLFYVPNYLFDPDTFELGARNGVYVTGLEHTMGLKSSPTCELTFGGADVPAVGYLVGGVHNGIAQMFTVIEHARMTIGVKSAGTLSTGYLNALAFAKERVQGADLTQMTDKTAPRVTIMHHPDVRRSLMTQKAYAEGLRALYLYAAAHQDDAVAQRVSGADHDMAHRVDDLLLPIVKGVGSERAYEILTESLQTLGGSGFLVDYPLEQYIRDAKIDSLYEGTTAIQALDFFFRKIVRDHGKALQFVLAQVTHTVENIDPSLKPQAELLRTALDDITAMTGALTGYLMSAAQHSSDIYKVGLGSVRYLLAVGDLLIGWRLLVLAGVAHAALADGPSQNDEAFYRGKIAVAAFFAKNMLPKLTGVRSVIENIDDDIMRVPEDAF
ncbi:acyl-CoA dehydrogenase [Mycobacterium tuberculosis]|nr:acyl-CoA dehydrogenase [Mycobacterium tuberculosis]